MRPTPAHKQRQHDYVSGFAAEYARGVGLPKEDVKVGTGVFRVGAARRRRCSMAGGTSMPGSNLNMWRASKRGAPKRGSSIKKEEHPSMLGHGALRSISIRKLLSREPTRALRKTSCRRLIYMCMAISMSGRSPAYLLACTARPGGAMYGRQIISSLLQCAYAQGRCARVHGT